MIKSKSELEELKILIESNFRILDRKISKSDRKIEAVIKKIKKDLLIQEYIPAFEERDIKIVTYTDD
jgi:uncharacterized protein YqiB (DUF1249 family)